MVSLKKFIETLQGMQMDFFAGVPDSLLKSLCAYLTDHLSVEKNIIAANEGAAVGLVAGHYLATGNPGIVYMQNSGLGNVVNPLMSLTDKEVYHIPLLLLIGWRGEPGVKDEPQHVKQGKVTLSLLEVMGIRFAVLSEVEGRALQQLKEAQHYIKETGEPFALVVRKGTFEEYKLKSAPQESIFSLSREEAIHVVAASMERHDIVVSTTGMISRELFEYREAMKQGHEKDFLTVGSMGHASQIALGIALQVKGRRVYCFDGDGAVLMHMGAMAIVASFMPNNYVHVVFNNGAHDSVGGQPTVALKIDMSGIAQACGYIHTFSVSDLSSLQSVLNEIRELEGPILLEIKVRKGARKDLGRPTTTPEENKRAFMEFLK